VGRTTCTECQCLYKVELYLTFTIIIQLSDLFLCSIFISTDSDTIIMPDITSKLYAEVIFLIVNIYSWGVGGDEKCRFVYFSSHIESHLSDCSVQ
jgi:hypothetical protein